MNLAAIVGVFTTGLKKLDLPHRPEINFDYFGVSAKKDAEVKTNRILEQCMKKVKNG